MNVIWINRCSKLEACIIQNDVCCCQTEFKNLPINVFIAKNVSRRVHLNDSWVGAYLTKHGARSFHALTSMPSGSEWTKIKFPWQPSVYAFETKLHLIPNLYSLHTRCVFRQLSARCVGQTTRSHPEDGDSTVLRNVGILPQHYTASQPRRPRLESSSLWKSQISYRVS
jgi:hypothetical protein